MRLSFSDAATSPVCAVGGAFTVGTVLRLLKSQHGGGYRGGVHRADRDQCKFKLRVSLRCVAVDTSRQSHLSSDHQGQLARILRCRESSVGTWVPCTDTEAQMGTQRAPPLATLPHMARQSQSLPLGNTGQDPTQQDNPGCCPFKTETLVSSL